VRTLHPDRICCVNHLIEITTYFKQQDRISDVKELLVGYLDKLSKDDRIHAETEGEEEPNIL